MINIETSNSDSKVLYQVDPSVFPVIVTGKSSPDLVLALDFVEGRKRRGFRGIYLTGDNAGVYFDDFVSTSFVTTDETVTLTISNK